MDIYITTAQQWVATPYACARNSAKTQPNQSVNGGTPSTLYNICPKGWKLPTRDDFYNLEDDLVSRYGDSYETYEWIFVHWWAQFGGEIVGDEGDARWTNDGSSGEAHYWTSRLYTGSNSDPEAYDMWWDWDNSGSTAEPIGSGKSVRCVAP